MAGPKSEAIHLYLDSGPKVSRFAHRALSMVVPSRRALEFYWSANCPYSYLMAQQLSRLARASGVVPIVRPMGMGSAEVNPSLKLRKQHGPRDCAALAEFYDVDFPSAWTIPDPALVESAKRIVSRALSLEACIEVGQALWRNDEAGLSALSAKFGEASAAEARELERVNAKRQRSAGHYHPATIRYFGEWFEGPTRTELVARRMEAKGHKTTAPWSRRPLSSAATSLPPSFEMWFSFRSPYSYLAAARIQAWREAGETFELKFRPVLPMVMRCLPVPRVKKMHLVKDAAREARRLGIPFGRIADPVGAGAQRCLALCAAVTTDEASTERAFDFAVAASTGIWSQGIDVATDAGLIELADRAGISRDEVMSALENLSAGALLAESNRDLMSEAGVWGVPCFRAGDFVTWGQDRLQLLRPKIGLPLLS